MDNDFMKNVEETCQYLGISKSTLYQLTHKKKIKFYCPNGKLIYFRKEDLDNWLLKNPVKTTEEIENEAANYVTLNR